MHYINIQIINLCAPNSQFKVTLIDCLNRPQIKTGFGDLSEVWFYYLLRINLISLSIFLTLPSNKLVNAFTIKLFTMFKLLR